jgi:hypothetical protein
VIALKSGGSFFGNQSDSRVRLFLSFLLLCHASTYVPASTRTQTQLQMHNLLLHMLHPVSAE